MADSLRGASRLESGKILMTALCCHRQRGRDVRILDQLDEFAGTDILIQPCERALGRILSSDRSHSPVS